MINEKNIARRSYSSKVILLGEYSIIHNGEILAAPTSLHNAYWKFEDPIEKRQHDLRIILDYLHKTNNKVLDTTRFENSIVQGIYLESDIPSGYGLGSSGAITAALYDLFSIEKNKKVNVNLLKQDLIDIESCFHGVSSGIDPLVIYLDKCIHIDQNGIHIIDKTLDLSRYFLIDTGKSRKTGPYVEQYLEKAKNDSYLIEIGKYKTMVKSAIQSQLSLDYFSLSKDIASISEWQYQHLDFAILDEFRNLWRSTLSMDGMSIKLCGAGGGGYLLGYALDIDRAISELNQYKVIRLC